MPIEDIDYLYENSEKENFVVLIDSDKRNRTTWLKPNEFQIDFDEPFTNVYGIDILDVNIPRTMFSVEKHTNTLKFKSKTLSKWYEFGDYTEFEIGDRDYTIQEFIGELNNVTNLLYGNNISTNVDATNVTENRKSVLKFVNNENPPQPFVFDMKHSSLSSVLGFDTISDDSNTSNYTKLSENQLNNTLNTNTPINDYLFASVPTNVQTKNISINATNSTNISAQNVFPISQNSVMFHEIIFQESIVYDENDSIIYAAASSDIDTFSKGFFISSLSFDATPIQQLTTLKKTLNIQVNDPIDSDKIHNIAYDIDITYPNIYFDIYKLDASNEELYISSLVNNTSSSQSQFTKLTNETHYMLYDSTTNMYFYNIPDQEFNKRVFDLIRIEPIGNTKYFINYKFDLQTYQNDIMSLNSDHIDKVTTNIIQQNLSKASTTSITQFKQNVNNSLNSHIAIIFNDQTKFNVAYNQFTSSPITQSVNVINPDQTVGSQSIPDGIYIPSTNLKHRKYNPTGITTGLSVYYKIVYIDSFELISPGLVKLFGERYVTIHCDNIEEHLKGSRMYNHYSPGLALVNLGLIGFAQVRTEFYSVKYKEFHPIGRLSNLKFSVKRNDGELYDFKNVNWHMLISVKYYAPKKMKYRGESSLNPNYMYNFMKYSNKFLHNSTITSDNDDSDEESVDEEMLHTTLMKKEQEYTQKYINEHEYYTDNTTTSNEDSDDESN